MTIVDHLLPYTTLKKNRQFIAILHVESNLPPTLFLLGDMPAKDKMKKQDLSILADVPKGFALDQIDIWFQDEARIGQRGTLTRT
jgi:hypothetical protein